MATCKSLCRKYKTEKGYLCDKLEKQGILNNKNWCIINKSDVDNYKKYLGDPFTKTNLTSQTNQKIYWDYVKETNPQQMCYSSGIKYYPCKINSNFQYMFGILIMIMATIGTVGGQHLSQTAALAGKTNKQILIFLVGKLRQLSQSELVDKGIIEQETLNGVISQLKDDINNLDETDKISQGKYIKNIFKISSDIIKNNTKSLSSLMPTSVMDFFIEHIPDEHAIEILKGGNFITEDDGSLYDWTTKNLNGYGRFSSHAKNASDVIQYGYTDMFVDSYLHLLCGKFKYENGKTVSWCQLEGAPMPPGLTTAEVFNNIYNGNNFNKKYLQYYIDHFVDSAVYFTLSKTAQLAGKKGFNLALGTSENTDSNPIYLAPFNLNEINAEPNPRGVSFNFTKNNFTYNLGIHNDIIASLNITSLQDVNETNTRNQLISPMEYKMQKKQMENPYGNNIGQGLGQQMYIPSANLNLGASTSQAFLSRGGKYQKKRKTRRKTNRKRKTRRNKK